MTETPTILFPSKSCFKCGDVKALTEFYAHAGMSDGRLGKCKECCKDYAALRRIRSERPREIDNRRYREGKKKPHSRAEWAKRNPEKYKAQNAVNNAIRDGRLKRQPCYCGAKAHAHHTDYSKPLEVQWLCPKHHSREHNDVL